MLDRLGGKCNFSHLLQRSHKSNTHSCKYSLKNHNRQQTKRYYVFKMSFNHNQVEYNHWIITSYESIRSAVHNEDYRKRLYNKWWMLGYQNIFFCGEGFIQTENVRINKALQFFFPKMSKRGVKSKGDVGTCFRHKMWVADNIKMDSEAERKVSGPMILV